MTFMAQDHALHMMFVTVHKIEKIAWEFCKRFMIFEVKVIGWVLIIIFSFNFFSKQKLYLPSNTEATFPSKHKNAKIFEKH